MKKIIILELCLMLFATTFKSDKMTGWIQQTIPRPDLPVVDLQFLDSLTGFMVSTKPAVDSAFIHKTTDGGNTWSTTNFENLYLTSIELIDKNTGYAAGATVGQGIIKKTTDGGNLWITVSSIAFKLFSDIEFVNKDTGWICMNSVTEGGLWRTTDGGISWQKQLNETYRPSKIFFVKENTGWVIGNAGQNLYKTTNSGINWFLQTNFLFISDVFFVSADSGWVIGYFTYQQTGILMTINGGDNWIECNNSVSAPLESRLFILNKKIGWAGSGPTKIFATKDGFNWGIQYSPIRCYNVSFVDTTIGWAGYSGLVHTTDGGGAIVSVNNENTLTPEDFILEQNYPNPFNSMTNVKWQMLNSGKAVIAVYDISGKEISVLVNGYKPAGSYSVKFSGSELPSGIYFCRLSVDGKPVSTKKMILAK